MPRAELGARLSFSPGIIGPVTAKHKATPAFHG
jgi:hypothetical protein